MVALYLKTQKRLERLGNLGGRIMSENKPLEIDDVWLGRIIANLEGLEFGSLLITVHDSKIMQIERTERRRFEPEHTGIQSQNLKSIRK